MHNSTSTDAPDNTAGARGTHHHRAGRSRPDPRTKRPGTHRNWHRPPLQRPGQRTPPTQTNQAEQAAAATAGKQGQAGAAARQQLASSSSRGERAVRCCRGPPRAADPEAVSHPFAPPRPRRAGRSPPPATRPGRARPEPRRNRQETQKRASRVSGLPGRVHAFPPLLRSISPHATRLPLGQAPTGSSMIALERDETVAAWAPPPTPRLTATRRGLAAPARAQRVREGGGVLAQSRAAGPTPRHV